MYTDRSGCRDLVKHLGEFRDTYFKQAAYLEYELLETYHID